MKRTDTKTLVAALRVLVNDIYSEDGVANACIAEAADRIEELERELGLSNKFLEDAKAAFKEKVDALEAQLAKAQLGIGEGTTRPHGSPEQCPTYYDGCNCTVEVLVHNIERAEKAEARVAELEGWISQDGLSVLINERDRYKEALEEIRDRDVLFDESMSEIAAEALRR